MHIELGAVRKARGAEDPSSSAGLGVHGEGPAFAVTQTLMLVTGDVAVFSCAHGQ